MEFELAVEADAVAHLSRLKSLTACREGRPRTQAVKIVWHDSPDRALLADGLTLAEQRGAWQLERLFPGAETWLPAQPPPVIAGEPDLTELPSPLAPLAAFEGRRTISVHHFAEMPVTLTVDKGTLRAVTAERPVVRIGLSGDEQAVRAAALLIAGAVPASVPVAALAAEAIAMATGRPGKPRRQGAPVLPGTELAVPEALAHIIGHLTDVILSHARQFDQPDGDVPHAVHQMRVAVRRARSAVSIFRPALQAGALDAVNDGLKALGGSLGPARDWDVFADETVPEIRQAIPGDERLVRLEAASSRQRTAHRKDLAQYLGGPAFRLLGIELAWFAAARSWHTPPEQSAEAEPLTLIQFADAVLQHRWRKLLSAGKRIEELDIPGLHGVRLRGKRLRYAAEMFSTLHDGKAANRFIDRLSDLQQRLGVLNDGAVASHLLLELGGAGGRHAYATGVVVGFLAARAERIRPRIIKSFERFKGQHAYWA
jgi:CHAD domain-containing protein